MNDLFQNDPSQVPREGARPETPAAPRLQFLRSPCECGAGGGWRMVSHYEILRCNCGKQFWALQPKRGGPLVALAWPGVVARPAYGEGRPA